MTSLRIAPALVAALALLPALAQAQSSYPQSRAEHQWAIAVHGGAGEDEWEHMDAQSAAAYRASMARALRTGVDKLSHGGRSLDAVEAVINAGPPSTIRARTKWMPPSWMAQTCKPEP
jgi:carbohydrate-selective porin OprB